MSKLHHARDAIGASLPRPSAPFDEHAQVLSLVDGLATAQIGKCCLLLWRETPTESLFQMQKEAMEYMTGEYPGETSILCVIEVGSGPPNQELRQAASKLLTDLGSKIRAVAFVIEGTGFQAAMIRGVLSSIELLKRDKSHPTRYFSNVAHAATWIALQGTQPSLEITQGVHYVRGRLDSLQNASRSLRASAERPSIRRFF